MLHTLNFVGKAGCFTTERLTLQQVSITLKELIYAESDDSRSDWETQV